MPPLQYTFTKSPRWTLPSLSMYFFHRCDRGVGSCRWLGAGAGKRPGADLALTFLTRVHQVKVWPLDVTLSEHLRGGISLMPGEVSDKDFYFTEKMLLKLLPCLAVLELGFVGRHRTQGILPPHTPYAVHSHLAS